MMIALVVGVVALAAYEWSREIRVVEHVAPWQSAYKVPADAKDVCYTTRPGFAPNTLFEFTVGEESFRAWAKADEHEVSEIVEPAYLLTYRAYADPKSDGFVTVSDGLYYVKMSKPDAGVRIAYDRRAKRAYYWGQTR